MITYKSGKRQKIGTKDCISIPSHPQSEQIRSIRVSDYKFKDEEFDSFVAFVSEVRPETVSMIKAKVKCDCGKFHTLTDHPRTSTSYHNVGCHSNLTKEHFTTLLSSSKKLKLIYAGLSFRFPQELERLESLATNTTLESLDLSQNRMSVHGYNHLMGLLNGNTTLKTLTLRGSLRPYKYEHPNPYSLDIRPPNCFLLPKNIAHLDLTYCDSITMQLGDKRSYIADLISNPNLISFRHDSHYVYNIEGVDPEMPIILQTLSTNTTLEVFRMACAGFNLHDLSAVLLKNSTLHTLTLGSSREMVTEEIISDVQQSAIMNTTITDLWFFCNPLDTMRVNLVLRNRTLYDQLIRKCSQFDFEIPKCKRQLPSKASNPKRQRKQ